MLPRDAIGIIGNNKAGRSSMGGEAVQVELGNNLDISSVAELRQQLAANLEQGLPLILAAAAVERMDTAAVQLLYAFVNHAKDQGIPVSWQEISDGMKDAFRFAGLESWLAGDTA